MSGGPKNGASSRFWAGIHFKSDIEFGWEIGQRVGEECLNVLGATLRCSIGTTRPSMGLCGAFAVERYDPKAGASIG